MDSQTGKIYDIEDIKKLSKEKKDKLVPFEKGEMVCMKGCYFKITYIRTDRSTITLQGIPAPFATTEK